MREYLGSRRRLGPGAGAVRHAACCGLRRVARSSRLGASSEAPGPGSRVSGLWSHWSHWLQVAAPLSLYTRVLTHLDLSRFMVHSGSRDHGSWGIRLDRPGAWTVKTWDGNAGCGMWHVGPSSAIFLRVFRFPRLFPFHLLFFRSYRC